jgi:predicted site-specific integrase-resolvase
MATATKLTTAEIAEQLEVDPKTLRRFMRDKLDLHAGKGARHAFNKREAAKIVKAFEKAHATADA